MEEQRPPSLPDLLSPTPPGTSTNSSPRTVPPSSALGGGLPPRPPRLCPGQAPGSWLRVPVDGKILMGFKLISWD